MYVYTCAYTGMYVYAYVYIVCVHIVAICKMQASQKDQVGWGRLEEGLLSNVYQEDKKHIFK